MGGESIRQCVLKQASNPDVILTIPNGQTSVTSTSGQLSPGNYEAEAIVKTSSTSKLKGSTEFTLASTDLTITVALTAAFSKLSFPDLNELLCFHCVT